jgi:hypothetical protein
MSLDRTDYKSLADKLWPYLSTRSNGSVSFTGGSSVGSGMSAHDLAGSYHTGALARSQAPWVAQDITDHKNLPDAHHSRLHSYFSTADHTFPTAAAFDVMGFTAANTPGKLTPSSAPGTTEKLLKTDASGYIALQRMTVNERLYIGNDYFVSDTFYLRYEGPEPLYITESVPQTLIYSANIYLGPNTGASTVHLRNSGLDSDDADLAYLFGKAKIGHLGYSNYAGFSHRNRASSGNYALLQYTDGNTYLNASSGEMVTHAIGGSTIFQTSVDRVNPAGSMFKDFGDYNRKWRTGFFAELYVETLVAQDVMATIGGRIMVAPTSKLLNDLPASNANVTIVLEHNSFVVGEYLYMMAAPGGVPQIEAFKIYGGPSLISGNYYYDVTRNLDGTGGNAWVIGDAVVSLGSAVGHGYIDITSTKTIHNHFGPTITHYVRSSTASWNSVAPVVTSGNLRSFVDYSTDEFGIAAGNNLTLTPSTGFKGYTMDRVAGLRLFNTHIELYTGANKIVELDQTNGLTFAYGTGALNKIRWFSGANETLQMGSWDWVSGSFSSAQYFARPKQSGWTARHSLEVYDFAGTKKNSLLITDIAAVFQRELLTSGIEINENVTAGGFTTGTALSINMSTDGNPIIWFQGSHDGVNNPETFATAGSIWKYVLIKVGNTLKKIAIYNV